MTTEQSQTLRQQYAQSLSQQYDQYLQQQYYSYLHSSMASQLRQPDPIVELVFKGVYIIVTKTEKGLKFNLSFETTDIDDLKPILTQDQLLKLEMEIFDKLI